MHVDLIIRSNHFTMPLELMYWSSALLESIDILELKAKMHLYVKTAITEQNESITVYALIIQLTDYF